MAVTTTDDRNLLEKAELQTKADAARRVAEENKRKTWLEERRKSIGASDAPKVCFGEAYVVWLDKLGQLQDTDKSWLRWGRLLEDVVAQAYSDETENPIFKPPSVLERHCTYPWMHASIDYYTKTAEGMAILECKTSPTGEGWGDAGTDQVPDYVNVQVQHQMACTGKWVAYIPLLTRGCDLSIYRVARSDPIIDMLYEIEQRFWELVQKNIPPEIDWQHDRVVEILRECYAPEILDRQIELPGPAPVEIVDSWEMWKERAKAADKEVERCRAQIEMSMGDSMRAVLDDGRTLRRAVSKVAAHTVQASTQRRLYLSKKGQKADG